MMAQNDIVVVGIDVAKDKVDACIRSLSLREIFPSSANGRRKLISWLRKHKVTGAVMEASGGYEREWAKPGSFATIAGAMDKHHSPTWHQRRDARTTRLRRPQAAHSSDAPSRHRIPRNVRDDRDTPSL